MSDEELAEAERHIDEILAKKDKVSETTEVSFEGAIREPEYIDWGKTIEGNIAAETQYNAILSGRKELNAEELALQERRAKARAEAERKQQILEEENLRKQQAAEEEKLRKQQIQEAEEQRLQGIKESAIVSDQHVVDLLQEQNVLQARLNDLKKAGVGYGHEEYDAIAARLKNINAEVKKYQAGLGNMGKASPSAKPADVPVSSGNVQSVEKEANLLTKGFEKARGAAKKCFGAVDKHSTKSSGMLGKVAGRVKGLMLSLMIFSQISKAFNAMVSAMSEGFQNLVRYSSDYNSAMSAMKSEMATLKNNLAAAFEPVVTAVIPYIAQLIGWLNKAVDTIGQFFAAISGKSTYTRAKKQVIDYAKSIEKATQAAKGALAAFDEINVLQDNSDTGSENAGGEVTGADAFETAEINSGIQEFASGVQALMDSLQPFKDMFDEWLTGLNFEPLLTSLGELKTACEPFVGYLYEGLLWFLSNVLAPIGTWTINQALPDTISMLASAFSSLGTVIETIKPSLDYIWNNVLVPIGSFTGEVFLWAIGLLQTAFTELSDLFTEKGDKINNILTAIGRVFELLWTMAVKPTIQFIMGRISAMVNYIFRIAGDVIDILDGIVEFVAGVFTGDWERAWDGIVGIFKGIINLCVDIVEKFVNSIISGLNFISIDVPEWVPLLGGKHFGFDIEPLSLPRLATGGIVTSSVLANIGEAGREAVLPLENNTEWMDMLADRIGGRDVNIRFEGSLSELGRILKPVIDTENARIGKNFRTT
ncbi:MAG: hypothetical protein NC123_16785 [Butyrivibrio sp.]|nr:hypothetical protein [Acetatifactor muris]MCM1561174.1 hypothetical protein [Butyrivibrio sp.]